VEFADRELKCCECGSFFIFSAGEQEFYRQKGFQHSPKRCSRCKERRGTKHRNESRVTCAECGEETTVPFKPTQGKPVFCRVCFFKFRIAANKPEVQPLGQEEQSGRKASAE
jgi:CxxC-x17-CxxC domain-containing protein